MSGKACKKCNRIIEQGNKCPVCNESDLTKHWKGYVIIVGPEKSEVAKAIGANTPGKYALRLGR